VELLPIEGETFPVKTDIIIKADNPKLTMRLKYFFMMEALMKDEGNDIHSKSVRALDRRFHIDRTSISLAKKDLLEYVKE